MLFNLNSKVKNYRQGKTAKKKKIYGHFDGWEGKVECSEFVSYLVKKNTCLSSACKCVLPMSNILSNSYNSTRALVNPLYISYFPEKMHFSLTTR